MVNLKKIFSSISKDVLLRFPIVFVFMFMCLIFAFFENHSIYIFEEQIQERVLFYFTLFIVFSTSIHLFLENMQRNKTSKIFFSIFTIGLGLYILLFVNLESFIFLFLASIISLVFSAFINKNSTNQSILKFNLDCIYGISFALLCSVILSLGIFAIVVSLDFLFGISFFKDNFDDINLFIFIIIFPILVLSSIPKKISFNKKEIKLRNSILILIKNILSPLVFVYTLILYAYFFKIVLLQELPKGDMAWIICVYLSLIILVKIFLVSIPKHNIFTKIINRYYLQALFIPIIFLSISIFTRVKEYGLTEIRYALILFLVWVIFIFAFTFIKKEFSIKINFISLFMLLFFASIPPFDATTLSIKSQIGRFEKILIDNNMLKEGLIIPNGQKLSLKTRADISSLVDYLTSNKAGKKELNNFLNKDFNNQDEVLKYLKVKYLSTYNINNKFYKPVFNVQNIAISTKGYEFVSGINLSEQSKEISFNKPFSVKLENSNLFVSIKEEVIKINLQEFLKKLKNKNIKSFDKSNYKNLIIEREKNSIKIKLFVLYFSNNKKDEIKYLDAFLMIGNVRN